MRKFREDRSGSYAAITAVLSLPLMFGVGTAVDFGRAEAGKRELQNVLDAAVLAGAAYLHLGEEEAIDKAAEFFSGNLAGKLGSGSGPEEPAEASGGGSVGMLIPSFEVDGGVLSGSVSYQMPTTFMQLAHINEVDITVESAASPAGQGMELVLVVDVSSSMSKSSGNEIAYLRAAAVDLMDTIYGDAETREDTWVGVAPFDGRVNVSAYNADWLDHTLVPKHKEVDDDCVGLRTLPNRISDATPEEEKFPPYFDDDTEACDGSAAMGLTAEKTPIRTMLANLQTGYGTSIWEGTAWGYRMLSPKWKGKWGNPDLPLSYEETPRKIAVIMTDGENTPHDYGDPFTTATANKMMVETCAAMKAEGIIIYSVAFKISLKNAQPMKDCATSEAHFFNLPKNDDLVDAFKSIAADLAKGSVRLVF